MSAGKKAYDRAYFDQWYHDPERRVIQKMHHAAFYLIKVCVRLFCAPRFTGVHPYADEI